MAETSGNIGGWEFDFRLSQAYILALLPPAFIVPEKKTSLALTSSLNVGSATAWAILNRLWLYFLKPDRVQKLTELLKCLITTFFIYEKPCWRIQSQSKGCLVCLALIAVVETGQLNHPFCSPFRYPLRSRCLSLDLTEWARRSCINSCHETHSSGMVAI